MNSIMDKKEIEEKIHELKTINPYFNLVKTGFKDFEVRKNDRDFQEGDWLQLKEYNPDTDSYSGAFIYKHIKYILKGGQFGIEKGYVVLGLDDGIVGAPISLIKTKY